MFASYHNFFIFCYGTATVTYSGTLEFFSGTVTCSGTRTFTYKVRILILVPKS
jgi:hypothetical protein